MDKTYHCILGWGSFAEESRVWVCGATPKSSLLPGPSWPSSILTQDSGICQDSCCLLVVLLAWKKLEIVSRSKMLRWPSYWGIKIQLESQAWMNGQGRWQEGYLAVKPLPNDTMMLTRSNAAHAKPSPEGKSSNTTGCDMLELIRSAPPETIKIETQKTREVTRAFYFHLELWWIDEEKLRFNSIRF